MFLEKSVLKICSKVAGVHPCRSEISLLHGCSPVNLVHIFRATSKTWTRTLDQDHEKPGPLKSWTLKNLDFEKPGPRKIWTFKNLDPEKHGINNGIKKSARLIRALCFVKTIDSLAVKVIVFQTKTCSYNKSPVKWKS